MNLIEKIGGYQEAKNHINSSWCDDENRAYLLDKLLEYRRENNIFEMGDYVIDQQHTGLLKVTRVMKKRLDVDYLNPQTLDVICHHSILIRYIRHATPEEIKAGHRLEAERHG